MDEKRKNQNSRPTPDSPAGESTPPIGLHEVWTLDEKNDLIRLYTKRPWGSFQAFYQEYTSQGGRRDPGGVFFALRQLAFAEMVSIPSEGWGHEARQWVKKERMGIMARKPKKERPSQASKEPLDKVPEGYASAAEIARATGYSTSWVDMRAKVHPEIKCTRLWALNRGGRRCQMLFYRIADIAALAKAAKKKPGPTQPRLTMRTKHVEPEQEPTLQPPPGPPPRQARLVGPAKLGSQSDEDRERIMDMMRRGHITTTQALELLDSLKR